jgi:hypothetical protein
MFQELIRVFLSKCFLTNILSQMLRNHLPDEAVELLVVAACGQCASASTLPPPGSRLSGVPEGVVGLTPAKWASLVCTFSQYLMVYV